MKYFAKEGDSGFRAFSDDEVSLGFIMEDGSSIGDYLEMDEPNSTEGFVAVAAEEYGKGIWAKPIISLSELKQTASRTLTDVRLQNEYAGPLVPVGDEFIRFASTPKDETRLTSVIDKMEAYPNVLPFIDNWKVGPEHFIRLDLVTAKKAQLMGFIHISNTFTVEQRKLAEINACETEEALNEWLDTQLHVGWDVPPEIYEAMLAAFV